MRDRIFFNDPPNKDPDYLVGSEGTVFYKNSPQQNKYRDPQYGEITRVPILTGEDRWVAQIEGKGADDLAKRSYTVAELRNKITYWMQNSDIDPHVLDQIVPGYWEDDQDATPWDMDALVEIYKKLWDYFEEHPKKKNKKTHLTWPSDVFVFTQVVRKRY